MFMLGTGGRGEGGGVIKDGVGWWPRDTQLFFYNL